MWRPEGNSLAGVGGSPTQPGSVVPTIPRSSAPPTAAPTGHRQEATAIGAEVIGVPEIVFVHGVGQQRWESGHALLSESWLPALQNGVHAAGRDDVAPRLEAATVAMVFYSRLFVERGAMGADDSLGDLDDEAADIAEALAREWIDRAANRAEDPGLGRDAQRALADLATQGGEGQAMGTLGLLRRASAAAAKLRFFARPTFAVAQAVVNRNLREVSHYLANTHGLREEIRTLALETVTPETRIVIAHSLGSVVAYEALHRVRDHSVDLLVTIGSPLGYDTIIYPRLDPAAAFPQSVKLWVNAADTDDIVAADPELSARFGQQWRGRIRDLRVRNGSDAHAATAYLSQPRVATPIADVLSRV